MSSGMETFFGKRVILFITGASRGLGREIAKQLGGKIGEGSVVILQARKEDDLKKLQLALSNEYPQVIFRTFASDAAETNHSEYSALFTENLNIDPEAIVVVHNVGTIGDVDLSLGELEDSDSVDTYMQVNVRNPIILSAAAIKSAKSPSSRVVGVFLVNISSLASSKEIDGLGLYCCAKAARRMYFSCLALENRTVRVLQYSPGPLDTEMMGEIRNSKKHCLQEFAKLTESRMVQLDDTVLKLCNILEEGRYKSGEHQDFFDRPLP